MKRDSFVFDKQTKLMIPQKDREVQKIFTCLYLCKATEEECNSKKYPGCLWK